MANIQAVFSDLDGTLLNSSHKITPLTAAAIRRLGEIGIPFVPVSGRGPQGIDLILEGQGLRCPIIAYSGALMLDEQRRVIFERGMSLGEARAVVDHLKARRFDLTWCAFSAKQWLVPTREDPRILVEEAILQTQATPGGLDRLQAGEVVDKLMCICDPEQLPAVEADVKAAFPMYTVVPSDRHLLEIMTGGVNKAQAMAQFCQLRQMDLRCVAAFGDQYNDLEMLQRAGYGIAMGNAPEPIRRAAGRVTADHDHDGVYYALQALGLA